MKVLVVDDEPSLRDICARTLKAKGHAVETASSGDEAVGRLGEPWDIILTDISMPGNINGLGVLRRARETGSADVLMMTAAPELDVAIQALKLGAYDFIVKPFSNELLTSAIQRCVDKRGLSVELAREKALRADLERAHAELARMQKVRDAFGLFVTPEVVNYVMERFQEDWKKGIHKTVTVLFADVRKFTPYAGSVSPETAVDSLNAIFSCAVSAIQKEGGILNKFMGDGMLALFGAPLDKEGHVQAAARAAASFIQLTDALADGRKTGGRHPLRIGIGIETGEVVAGFLGAEDRREYSVIGHSVNLAARLEKAAGPGQILLGPNASKALRGEFHCREVGMMDLPGIAASDPIWELLPRRQADVAHPSH